MNIYKLDDNLLDLFNNIKINLEYTNQRIVKLKNKDINIRTEK